LGGEITLAQKLHKKEPKRAVQHPFYPDRVGGGKERSQKRKHSEIIDAYDVTPETRTSRGLFWAGPMREEGIVKERRYLAGAGPNKVYPLEMALKNLKWRKIGRDK